MQYRHPRTHLTCGFCMRSKPHETKSGQPICDDCLEEYNRCFPLTEVNNLSIVTPVASLIHLERDTP